MGASVRDAAQGAAMRPTDASGIHPERPAAVRTRVKPSWPRSTRTISPGGSSLDTVADA